MTKYLLYVSHLYSLSIVRPLQTEIIKRGGSVRWYLARKELVSYLKAGEISLDTGKDIEKYNSDVVFVASNSVPHFFPGIKVQLFHGFNAQKRESETGHFRIRGFFDLYCTQGPSTTNPFLMLENKHKYFKVIETGWPKMDPLFNTDFKKNDNHGTQILFTSTFTPSLSAAHKIFDTIKRLSEKKNWNFTVTFHPKMDPGIANMYKNLKHVNYVETDDVIPLLADADIMLSDTSSILSEFILQQKPVVTYRNRVPEKHLINVTDEKEIESALEAAQKKPIHLMEEIKKYIDHIHPYRDGASSGRVLDAADTFLTQYKGKLKKKPLNLFRFIKMKIRHR